MAPASLVALFVAAPALAGGPLLDITGPCPGLTTLDITGLTPGGTVAILKGSGMGSDILPGGPCAGAVSSLRGLGLVTTLWDADRDGVVTLIPSVRAPACGASVQALDASSCILTNVEVLGDEEACEPSGLRAPFNAPARDTVTGCYDGDFCDHDDYVFGSSTAKIFAAYGETATCSGPSTCVSNVGITTYDSESNCQGAWDVYCDDEWVGLIDTVGRTCTGSAQGGDCTVSFPARECTEITFEAIPASAEEPTGCCLWGAPPDTAISSASAW